MCLDELNIKFDDLCRKYGVVKLEIFGSFARGDAKNGSDIDLIAKFGGLKNLTDRFFGFKSEIELMTNHAVDIIPDKAIRNPIFAKNVNRDRRVIYG